MFRVFFITNYKKYRFNSGQQANEITTTEPNPVHLSHINYLSETKTILIVNDGFLQPVIRVLFNLTVVLAFINRLDA